MLPCLAAACISTTPLQVTNSFQPSSNASTHQQWSPVETFASVPEFPAVSYSSVRTYTFAEVVLTPGNVTVNGVEKSRHPLTMVVATFGI